MTGTGALCLFGCESPGEPCRACALGLHIRQRMEKPRIMLEANSAAVLGREGLQMACPRSRLNVRSRPGDKTFRRRPMLGIGAQSEL